MKDLWRLLQKGSVYSRVSSFIFRMTPAFYLTSVLIAILFIPFGSTPGLLSFDGDFIFFAYILALGKFLLIVAAMDTGSSFEGMGASREALFSMLAEPAFFILFGSFGLYTGHTSFLDIFNAFHFESYASYTMAVLSSFILVVFALIENSRMPLDDPKTHLELTMIHEVMVLDHSGFDLGLIVYTSYLKFAMFGALIANILIEAGASIPAQLSVFAIVQCMFAIIVGIVESFSSRFRMNHNSQFVLSMTSICLLIFLGISLMLGKID
jgi:formate hydrogenlyase subunit 4